MSHKSNVFALKMIHIVGSILIITAIAATMHPAYSE